MSSTVLLNMGLQGCALLLVVAANAILAIMDYTEEYGGSSLGLKGPLAILILSFLSCGAIVVFYFIS
jgi:hypothetical protein